MVFFRQYEALISGLDSPLGTHQPSNNELDATCVGTVIISCCIDSSIAKVMPDCECIARERCDRRGRLHFTSGHMFTSRRHITCLPLQVPNLAGAIARAPSSVHAVGQRQSCLMLFVTPIAKRLSGLLGFNRSPRTGSSPQADNASRHISTMSNKQRQVELSKPPSRSTIPTSIAGQKRKAEAFEIIPSSKDPQNGRGRPTKFVRARGPYIAAFETRERTYEATLVSVEDEVDQGYICGLIIRGYDREKWNGTCTVPAQQIHPVVAEAFQQFKEDRDASEDSDEEVIVVKERVMRLNNVQGRNIQGYGEATVDEVIGPLVERPEIFTCSLSFRLGEEGSCCKGRCQIPKNDIQEWKLVDWEGERNGLPSTEVYDRAALDELRRLETMHTVEFYGKLVAKAVMQVDLYRRDGEDFERRSAEVVGLEKKGDVLTLRFRVEVATRTWMYLYGTMHAEMKHGRFAEENPGKVRTQ